MPAVMPDLEWTVNQTIQRHPTTARVFNSFGVDSCCGGGATLDAAARDAGVSPEELLRELRLVVAGEDDGAVVA